jgi:hypothetical protein
MLSSRFCYRAWSSGGLIMSVSLESTDVSWNVMLACEQPRTYPRLRFPRLPDRWRRL